MEYGTYSSERFPFQHITSRQPSERRLHQHADLHVRDEASTALSSGTILPARAVHRQVVASSPRRRCLFSSNRGLYLDKSFLCSSPSTQWLVMVFEDSNRFS